MWRSKLMNVLSPVMRIRCDEGWLMGWHNVCNYVGKCGGVNKQQSFELDQSIRFDFLSWPCTELTCKLWVGLNIILFFNQLEWTLFLCKSTEMKDHLKLLYFLFKYDLGQKYCTPQLRPDRGSNSWPPDHDSTFHVTEMSALTTRPSVPGSVSSNEYLVEWETVITSGTNCLLSGACSVALFSQGDEPIFVWEVPSPCWSFLHIICWWAVLWKQLC